MYGSFGKKCPTSPTSEREQWRNRCKYSPPLARFEVSRFMDFCIVVWPKAMKHRSLGHRPRTFPDQPRRLAEGHNHGETRRRLNMAFGQNTCHTKESWGDAPGYGEKRPSARSDGSRKTQLQNLRVGFVCVYRNGTFFSERASSRGITSRDWLRESPATVLPLSHLRARRAFRRRLIARRGLATLGPGAL